MGLVWFYQFFFFQISYVSHGNYLHIPYLLAYVINACLVSAYPIPYTYQDYLFYIVCCTLLLSFFTSKYLIHAKWIDSINSSIAQAKLFIIFLPYFCIFNIIFGFSRLAEYYHIDIFSPTRITLCLASGLDCLLKCYFAIA